MLLAIFLILGCLFFGGALLGMLATLLNALAAAVGVVFVGIAVGIAWCVTKLACALWWFVKAIAARAPSACVAVWYAFVRAVEWIENRIVANTRHPRRP